VDSALPVISVDRHSSFAFRWRRIKTLSGPRELSGRIILPVLIAILDLFIKKPAPRISRPVSVTSVHCLPLTERWIVRRNNTQ
jgi:hypothetical protein